MAAAMVLVVSACGGSGGGSVADSDSSDGEIGDDVTASGEVEAQSGLAGGTATFAIDGGDTVVFSMDPVEYSPNAVINDVTFEACTANFFGVGMFYAIGYPVSSDGTLVLSDSGDIAGSVEIEVPPDDWAERGLDNGDVDIEFQSDVLGLDLRMASPERAAELAPGVDHSWVIGDNRLTGTGVFTDVTQDVFVVDFEATCR